MIGSLYFIQEGLDGAIKIGWTKADPHARLATLEVGNSNPLRLLAALKNHPDAEKTWHNRFAGCRKHREWFWPTRDLLNAIEEAVSTHQEPTSRIVPFVKPMGPHDLRAWLKKNKWTISGFAKELGYSNSYLGEYLRHGWVRMNPRLANRIETVTKGEIKAVALLRGEKHLSTQADKALAQAVSA